MLLEGMIGFFCLLGVTGFLKEVIVLISYLEGSVLWIVWGIL
jgi:hypothetical protein